MYNMVVFSGVGCFLVIVRGGIVGWFFGDVFVFISLFWWYIVVVVFEILVFCCEF